MIDPSFLRKRKTKWKFPLEAFLLHVVVIGLILLVERSNHYQKLAEEAQDLKNKTLNVKPISEEEFQKLLPHQIVDTKIVNPLKIKPKDQAKYLGEKTQRVQKETQSKNFGAADGGNTSAASATQAAAETLPEPGFGSQPKIGKALEQGEKSILQKGNANMLGPDVAVSADTILNTDEYVYSSFFNRMRDAIAGYWQPRVLEIIESRHNSKMGPGIYRTDLRIFISRDGQVLDVSMKNSSGVKELDTAATSSVFLAHQFQNPPAELFAKDPRADIEFGFYVQITPHTLLPQFNYVPDDRLNH